MRNGYIKLIRGEKLQELFKDPKAFTFLSVIAYRARRTNMFNVHNLKPGEALVGDHKNYGLSQQEYRTSKAKLEKWGLATFKGTPNGTIATLTDDSIYDINIEREQQAEQQIQQQASNERSNKRATTNKECKNGRMLINRKGNKNYGSIEQPYEEFVR
jgi:hypothetical protein